MLRSAIGGINDSSAAAGGDPNREKAINHATRRTRTMHFKLIISLVEDDKTDGVMKAARMAGATGATIINHARGEGVEQAKTFFGLSLETNRDVVLFLVEEHLSRQILETIAQVGEFDDKPGTGIAFQIDVEDAVGVSHQIRQLSEVVEEKL
jgi:nitrogen regulatory protein PII